VVGNDKPGAASAPLDGTTVKITTAGADPDGKGLTTTDGTWTVDPVTGSITFAPAAGYTGDAVITYQVADANGTLTSATVTVTVPSPAAPTVLPDTNHTPYLTPVTTSVLGNDAAGGLAKLQKGSVVFSNGLTSLTNADGIYTVNGTTGDITFAPAPGFSGPATPVTYRVSDELGQTGSATLTVTVGTAPKATDDQTTTPQGVAVTIPELGDDTAGTDGAGVTGTLTKTSVVFTSASATLGGKKLVVANEGTWTIDATTGDATFTPLPTFTGPTTAVDYQVTDSFGNTAAAQLKVVVDGLTPSAGNDTNHGEFGATVTTNVLGNDHGAAPSAPLDPTSVTIVGAPGTGRTLAVPGQGTWTVNATTGAITFTPAAGFHGTPDPITYQVLDYNGTPATATLTVTIGNPPAATDDSAHTPFRTPVTLTPLANDTAGDDGAGVKVALDPADLVFTSSAATNSGRDLTTAEGTWAISATTGMVTFTPVSTFSGPTASVAYEITDSYGHTATAHLTVTVGAPPAASDDSATTTQNVTVTIATPLANDAAGNNGAGVAGTLVPASVVFTSASASPDGKSLTTSEGVWTIDATTGVPTFDPNPDYVGTTKPVAYQVTDSFGNVASAHWTVKVDGITPTALDDTNHGPYGSAVTTPVLGNDTAGAVSAPLVPTSVVITTVGASPDGKTLDVPGKGTWTVDAATGAITFTPVAGFHGTPAPITYQVADANGTITQAKLTVTIGNPPAATDDAASTSQNTPVSLDLLANDVAGDNGGGTTGTLDPASVAITTAGVSADGRTLVLVGKGVFTVDPATGKATFTPEPSFTGDVPVVTYTVTDSFGHTTTAEIHVTVVPVVPLAANDASTSGYGSPVTIDILGNDQPGDTHTSLVPSTLVFTDAAATEGGKVLFVAGQGTWRVNSDGTVTFTPAEGFSGRTSPVGYRVSDTNGVVTTASITVVVAAGPAASDDQVKGSRRTISVPVLANDHAGDGCTMDPSTVVLLDSDGNWIDATGSLVVDGEGAWTVNADGTLTFAATASFHGWTSWATYRVTDSCSHTAQALARVWVPQDSGDSLAYTGVAVGGVVGAAILLLVGGGLLLALRGRRRGTPIRLTREPAGGLPPRPPVSNNAAQ
jgi:CshA-type fibril repeat protein